MLYSTTFLTLDGVMSDPHLWHPAYASDESIELLSEQLDAADALLVGRRTYEGFASYWPDQDDTVPLARRTNEIPKHVVTSSHEPLLWTGSSVIEGDLVTAVSRLKECHEILVPGGATLLQSLLQAGVLDEMRVYVDPIVMGHGQRLFVDGLTPVRLEMVDQKALPKGVLYLAYRPTRGRVHG